MLPGGLLESLPPALAVMLRLIDIAFYAAVLLLLARFLLRAYYMHGHGPWVAAIFSSSERMCGPLRVCLPRSWFGVRDYAPLVAIAILLVVKPLAEAALVAFLVDQPPAPDRVVSWLSLFASYTATGGVIMARHVALAGTVLLFLAFCWQRAGRFWGRFAFTLLDEITLPYFRWTARALRLRSNWSVVIAAILLFSLACGAAAALAYLFGGLLLLPVRSHLPEVVQADVAYLDPGSLQFIGFSLGLLLGFLFQPVLTVLQLLFAMCFILILMSWFQPNREGLLFRMVVAVAGPPLSFVHRLAPWARIGMLNFSPIILFLGLMLSIRIVQRIMYVISELLSRAFS